MTKNHLKRINVPRTWNIHRKKTPFIARPNPGGQSMDLSLPLGVLLIENIGLMRTKREVKYALNNKEILVNLKHAKDVSKSVGLLDTISIPKLDKHWRIVLNSKNKLAPVEIDKKESIILLSKVTGKKSLKKEKIQITTINGRAFLIDKTDKTKIKVGDTVLIELPSQKIKEVLSFEKGQIAYLFGGKYAGDIVKIDAIEDRNITFTQEKNKFETRKEFAIIIGKDKPKIQLIPK